ncbi:MAG: GHKL domain-containing protein [Roseburia sp.]|nr:GHKL domain-containing protein [Roseburia sp.]MCM1242214.1 GHKL domain-containing protein [Roseburia sp.]
MDVEKLNQYYEIITAVFDHLEMLATAGCFFLLCRYFLRKKKYAWASGGVYFILLFVQYHIPVYMGGMIAHIVAGLGAFLCMVLLERTWPESSGNLPVRVFFSFFFFTVEDLATEIATELFILVSYKMDGFIFALWKSDAGLQEIYFSAFCFGSVFLFLVKALLMFLMVLLLNKAFVDKEGRYEWKEIAIMLIPSAAGFTVHMLRRTYDNILEELGWDFYGPYEKQEILMSVHCIIILVILLLVVFLFQNLRKKQDEEKKRALLQSQIQNMQSHITETERIYERIGGIRHDLNNHVYVISSLLERRQYEDAQTYLEKLRGAVDTFEILLKTGNPVTDIIINEKCREARQKGITFEADFHYVQEGLDVFDVSVILNNALENAFEAAAATAAAYVSLQTCRKKNAYLIIVRNSYDGKLRLSAEGIPETTKDDRGLHGLGLKNIRSVVEKYFGTLAIEQSGNEVILTIMLMIGDFS